MNEETLYQKAIRLWGFDSQVHMMLEEMAELEVELLHVLRSRGSIEAVMEELADVEIMLNQMKIIFPPIERMKEEKLKKLEILLKKHEKRI